MEEVRSQREANRPVLSVAGCCDVCEDWRLRRLERAFA